MKIIENEKSRMNRFQIRRHEAFNDERIHTISRLWRDNLIRLQRGNRSLKKLLRCKQ